MTTRTCSSVEKWAWRLASVALVVGVVGCAGGEDTDSERTPGETSPAVEAEAAADPVAPSFDCSQAEGNVQNTICANSSLAQLDNDMAEIWARAQARLPEQELSSATAYQRGWIKGRDECWKEPEDLEGCVRDKYLQRMTELQIAAGLVEVPDYESYQCKSGQTLLITFYENTRLDAAVLTYGDDQVVAFANDGADGADYAGRNVLLTENNDDEVTLEWSGVETQCKSS